MTTIKTTPAAAVEIALDEGTTCAAAVGYAIADLDQSFADVRALFAARHIICSNPDDALFADAGWVDVYGDLVHTGTGAVIDATDDRERARVEGELLAAATGELRADMADNRRIQ